MVFYSPPPTTVSWYKQALLKRSAMLEPHGPLLMTLSSSVIALKLAKRGFCACRM